jgi:predicted AlkP superfamily pyrophosphatase or phosphodiesterase
MRLAAAALLCAACATASPARHAIVISVDGLMPETYLEPDRLGLRVPTLRALAASGIAARGARPAFPTSTYPNHTTIATGVLPATHGIVSNETFDPEEKNRHGWDWYAEDIRVPALWDAAAARGLRTLLVSWPVTVGARATALMPEIWRAGTADDQKLLRALSSDGVLAAAAARFPDLWTKLTPPGSRDEGIVDVAVANLERLRPDLTMVHFFQTDLHEHDFGPGSPEARAAIEVADAQIARLLAAARAAGILDRTLVVIVSDHGFKPVDRGFAPSALLRERGFIDVDADGKVTAWRAATTVNGGSAYVYLRDPADRDTARAVAALFAEQAAVRRVLDAADLAARGGDPRALLAIEAADGWSFVSGAGGPVTRPFDSRGQHGFGDDRPEMRATLLVAGPGIAPRVVDDAALVDVAPTVAAWLGLSLPAAKGRSLLISPLASPPRR